MAVYDAAQARRSCSGVGSSPASATAHSQSERLRSYAIWISAQAHCLAGTSRRAGMPGGGVLPR